MRNDVKWMSPREASTAAENIRMIERYLGKPIPGGMVDTNSLSKRWLSNGEAATYANNIEQMMRHAEYKKPTMADKLVEEGDTVTQLVFVVLVVVIFGGAYLLMKLGLL